ncbi:hypothetical protein TNCV_1043361 [Trichonephila clavipes]|nr:hypothetical protein TNCV_1043361 [Trichonephila clavipes]
MISKSDKAVSVLCSGTVALSLTPLHYTLHILKPAQQKYYGVFSSYGTAIGYFPRQPMAVRKTPLHLRAGTPNVIRGVRGERSTPTEWE